MAVSQQNILIIMLNTPKKLIPPKTEPNSSLKEAINIKISHKSSVDRSKNKDKQQNHPKRSPEIPELELKLLEAIEMYESESETGYLKYNDWISFNTTQFSHVCSQTVKNLWKIMRIINYGEVNIPTGLIYEISVFFMTKNRQKRSEHSVQLKDIINMFLSANHKKDCVNNFRELANYPHLESIEQQYCPEYYQSRSCKGKPEEKPVQKDKIFERLFKEGRTRGQSLQKLKYASMTKELMQCKFTPNIGNYKSKAETKRCERVCQHTDVKPSMLSQQPTFAFVAREIDKRIYDGKLEDVPGVREHIKRAQASEAERQRIQRYLTKPWLKVR